MIKYLQTGASLYANTYPSLARLRINLNIAQAESVKAKASDNKLLSDKLLEKIQEKGIPVDVDNFMNRLADFEESIDRGFGVNKRSLYALQAQANRIILQADYLEKAEKNAENKESLNEIAVGGRGELYVMSDQDIKAVSASTYDAEKDGPAMTVGELIQHRKFNPNQAFDTLLTRTINDNLGMSKITEYIQKIVSTVGSAENTQEAYIDLASYIGKEAAKKPTLELLISLKSMAAMMLNSQLGADAIFKIKDSEQGRNLKAAFEYLLAILPRDMKTLLIGRNVAIGNKFETGGTYIQSLIAHALESSNLTKSDHSITYQADINTGAGTKAGTTKDQMRNLGVLEGLVQGSLGLIDYKLISSENPVYSLNLHGTGIGTLANFDNELVGSVPLTVALQSGLLAVVDINHITMGTQRVSPGMADSILYGGELVINVWAPTNENGDVDLNRLLLLQQIQDHIKKYPEMTDLDKQALLLSEGLEGYFDEKNNFHGSGDNMAQFLVMTGITSDEILDASNNPYADELKGSLKNLQLEQINRVYGQLNQKLKGSGKFKFKTGWFDFTTDIYRVPIFMRLNRTAQIDAGTFSNKGPMVRTPSYLEQLAYDLILNKPATRQVITPSTSALYQ